MNALTDSFHPCQILADLATVAQHRGGVAGLAGLTLAYVGDGANNMAHSYLLGGATAGLHVRIGTPDGYLPDAAILADAAAIAADTGGSVTVVHTLAEAVTGADVVATDTWVSMGQEAEAADRETPFVPFRVDAAAMALAAAGRPRPALPARLPRQGDHRRGARRPAVGRLGRGREPAARAEGPPVVAGGGLMSVTGPAHQGRPARAGHVAARPAARSTRSSSWPSCSPRRASRVTQATLSRDLVELRAVKIRTPSGALAYAVPAEGGDCARPRRVPTRRCSPPASPGCAPSSW